MRTRYDGTDLYALLGVASTATAVELKTAYRRLAMQWHPDRHAQDPVAQKAAEEKFKAISAAYDVLRDPVRRQEYDYQIPRARETRTSDYARDAQRAQAEHDRQYSQWKEDQARERARREQYAQGNPPPGGEPNWDGYRRDTRGRQHGVPPPPPSWTGFTWEREVHRPPPPRGNVSEELFNSAKGDEKRDSNFWDTDDCP